MFRWIFIVSLFLITRVNASEIIGKFVDREGAVPEIMKVCDQDSDDRLVTITRKTIDYVENSCKILKKEQWNGQAIWDYKVKCAGSGTENLIISEEGQDIRIQHREGPLSKTTGSIYRKCPSATATTPTVSASAACKQKLVLSDWRTCAIGPLSENGGEADWLAVPAWTKDRAIQTHFSGEPRLLANHGLCNERLHQVVLCLPGWESNQDKKSCSYLICAGIRTTVTPPPSDSTATATNNSQPSPGEQPRSAAHNSAKLTPQPAADADKPKVNSKIEEGIILVYQQYMTLKLCEANSNGQINLNSLRSRLKDFDSSIERHGYNPASMFTKAKEAPMLPQFKIIGSMVAMLPMTQGSDRIRIIGMCQQLMETEHTAINLVLSSDSADDTRNKVLEKDF